MKFPRLPCRAWLTTIGRGILPEDGYTGNNVAVLGHAVWQRDFGGSADALGQIVRIDGREHTIVGVAPPGLNWLNFEPIEAAIWVPIRPGIVPIHNYKQVAGFSQRAGASMPSWLAHRFEGLEDDPATSHLVAAAVATEQVMDLVDEGVKKFHFYTLNRADLVYAICHLLGLRPHQVVRGATQRAAV